jgi:osmotically-inducible protein OsmY
MLANTNLRSSSIKVITENGIVFLMGMVTREQGKIAADIARESSGVQRVVTLFSYKVDGKKAKQ